jgi:nitrogen fixation/metabolism regulation signal transduction histidine kinase
MFDQVFSSIIIFLLSYIGILSIKKAPGAGTLIIPLIIAVVFRIVAGRKFARPLKSLAVHAAADLDRADMVRLATHNVPYA